MVLGRQPKLGIMGMKYVAAYLMAVPWRHKVDNTDMCTMHRFCKMIQGSTYLNYLTFL